MFGQHPHAVQEMIERLHDSLCCYRDLRAKYRGRPYRSSPPVTASASPSPVGPPAAFQPPAPPQPPPQASVSPQSEAVSATSTPPPPTPAPALAPGTSATPASTASTPAASSPAPDIPGQGDWVLVAYRTVQGRQVPVYAELGEVVGPGAAAGSSNAAANRDPSTPVAPAGQAATTTSPDTAPAAANTPAAPRSQQTAAPLSLEPPKPPTIVREGDPTSPIERVLAEHRVLLAEQFRAEGERHAAVLRDLLTEHQQALAAEGERHRAELAQMYTQHQAELREVSARIEGDRAAMAELRERLAEQAAASAEQNACLGDMIANLVETVSRLALSRTSPPAPTFAPPPRRVATVSTDGPDITDSASPAEDRAKPQAEPTPTSSLSATKPAPSNRATMESPATPRGPTAPTRTAPPASPPCEATSTRAPLAGAPGTKAGHGSLLAVVMEMDPAPVPAQPTARQRRAEEEARHRQRMYEAIEDDADDVEDIADDPEVMEAPRA